MDGRQRDVGGITIRPGRKEAGVKDFTAQFICRAGRFKQWKATQHFQSLTRHYRFAFGDFVQHDLLSEQFMLLAFQIPPVAG